MRALTHEGVQKMNDEYFSELMDLIVQLKKDPAQFDRADMDELALLTKTISNNLSDRFISVVEAFDKKFSLSTSDKREFLDRLVRIAEVTDRLPQTPSIQDDSIDLVPEFHLDKADKKRIFDLCSGMRKIVFASEIFDDPHKKRLLNRIAAIEKEVHQNQGKLDTVLAGVVDVGDALGKFGRSVEPLTKRMQEIANIARRGSEQYQQIPPPEEKLSLPAPDTAPESNA